jgi:hypothetical protein
VLALAAAGCSDASTPTNNGCPGGKCAPEMALLAAEVTPAVDRGALPAVEFAQVDVDPVTGDFTLTLPDAVRLDGVVSIGGLPAGATVVATRRSRITGRPDVYYQTNSDPQDGSYALLVVPNNPDEAYTLRVVPRDADVSPPQQFKLSATTDAHLDLTLDDPTTLVVLRGRVLDAVKAGVAGMKVAASDPTTRALVSTSALTDGTGAYALKLSRMAPSTVQLSATPTADAAPGTPSLTLSVDISRPAATNAVTADLDVPPLPAVRHLMYKIGGVGSSGAETPVAGAHCLFSANVSDPKTMITAIHEASAETDAAGVAAVDLLPSQTGNRDYQVSVSPAASAPFQATVTTTSVGPVSGWAAPITLGLRPQVSGRAVDANHAPLRNVVVQPGLATVAASSNATSLALFPNLSTVQTDGDGRFAVRIDSGIYDFGLIPAPAAHLPRLWLENTQVTSDTDLAEIVLPTGTTARGQVRLGNGAPLVGANVRLYAVSGANAMCRGADLACLQPPRLRAEGTTDSAGEVPLLLPAKKETTTTTTTASAPTN